jgi:hypothetical protein
MPEGRPAGDGEGAMPIHSHDTPRAVRKLHEREHVADVGESDKTPVILFGEVWFVTAVTVLVLVAVSLLAYRLAS